MGPDDLLCSRNAHVQKVWRKGVKSFLCSRNARPQKGLARRPHVDHHGCPSQRGKESELGRIN